MRNVLFLLSVLVFGGCDVYIEEPHRHSVVTYEYQEYCDDSEPYWSPAEEYHIYYDYYGYYEGECGIWYLGHGYYEEWCLWEDQCGWDYVTSWYH